MLPGSPALRFAWWNVQSFAHFDPNRAEEERWPTSQAEYATKCQRVDAAIEALITNDPPDLLGLCEITDTAAEELRQRLFPSHLLLFPAPATGTAFQVAVLLDRSSGWSPQAPLVATQV